MIGFGEMVQGTRLGALLFFFGRFPNPLTLGASGRWSRRPKENGPPGDRAAAAKAHGSPEVEVVAVLINVGSLGRVVECYLLEILRPGKAAYDQGRNHRSVPLP